MNIDELSEDFKGIAARMLLAEFVDKLIEALGWDADEDYAYGDVLDEAVAQIELDRE